MSDDRLDQLIRASLDWQAGRVAAAQPSMRQATGRLADRLRAPGMASTPRLTLTPSSAASLNVLTIALLLLGLALAWYVGTQLNTPPVPPSDLRFGFPISCEVTRHNGLAFDEANNQVVLSFVAEDGPDTDVEPDFHSLYADGRLVQDVSVPGETRVDNLTGSEVLVRHLTEKGRDLLLARVAGADLTPGCRFLQTDAAGGSLMAWTESGGTEVSWGPGGSSWSHRLDAADEAALVALMAALAHPETWLPGDAWIDSTGQRIEPDHWLIRIDLRPTQHRPGDTVELTDGSVLDGSDPRNGLVVLPAGQDAEAFGDELPIADPFGPGSAIRCAVASLDEAVALAASLESLENTHGLGTDTEEGEVFTEDLFHRITFGIQPVFGAAYDCGTLALDWQFMTAPVATPSPEVPVGALADIDPCELAAPAAAAVLEVDGLERRPSRLPLGVPAWACAVFDAAAEEIVWPEGTLDAPPAGHRVTVTLYPASVDLDAADGLVASIFGTGLPGSAVDGHPAWDLVDCDPEALEIPCRRTVVGWSRGHLIVFEFTAQTVLREPDAPPVMGAPRDPIVSAEAADAFVASMLAGIAP
ncbi:MAG: hypothetical protein L0227_17575 [Chloroflexi bacterium]|nr:hypothetical protein [Chloroflexota bacterium]